MSSSYLNDQTAIYYSNKGISNTSLKICFRTLSLNTASATLTGQSCANQFGALWAGSTPNFWTQKSCIIPVLSFRIYLYDIKERGRGKKIAKKKSSKTCRSNSNMETNKMEVKNQKVIVCFSWREMCYP